MCKNDDVNVCLTDIRSGEVVTDALLVHRSLSASIRPLSSGVPGSVLREPAAEQPCQDAAYHFSKGVLS